MFNPPTPIDLLKREKERIKTILELPSTTIIVLFKSSQLAKLMAFTLNGNWDNCNGITLKNINLNALQVALEIAKHSKDDFCLMGAASSLQRSKTYSLLPHQIIPPLN